MVEPCFWASTLNYRPSVLVSEDGTIASAGLWSTSARDEPAGRIRGEQLHHAVHQLGRKPVQRTLGVSRWRIRCSGVAQPRHQKRLRKTKHAFTSVERSSIGDHRHEQ